MGIGGLEIDRAITRQCHNAVCLAACYFTQYDYQDIDLGRVFLVADLASRILEYSSVPFSKLYFIIAALPNPRRRCISSVNCGNHRARDNKTAEQGSFELFECYMPHNSRAHSASTKTMEGLGTRQR